MNLENDTSRSIKAILEYLLHKNVDISTLDIVDFYAKDCSWQTKEILKYNNNIQLWEIDHQYYDKLCSFVGKQNVVICDSYEYSKVCNAKFDFVILDNPLNVHGNYCEHFDALPCLRFITKKQFYTVFNIKLKPYDYDNTKNIEWKKRRDQYYNVVDSSNLQISFVKKFYKEKFEQLDFNVKELRVFTRPHEDGLISILVKAIHVRD